MLETIQLQLQIHKWLMHGNACGSYNNCLPCTLIANQLYSQCMVTVWRLQSVGAKSYTKAHCYYKTLNFYKEPKCIGSKCLHNSHTPASMQQSVRLLASYKCMQLSDSSCSCIQRIHIKLLLMNLNQSSYSWLLYDCLTTA